MSVTNSVDMKKGGKSFNVAQSCASLMLCLANDILDFAQLEANSLILNLDPNVDLRAIL